MSFEIGAYGDALARTPNLDRLAQEGVRYDNAFSTAGVCAPSRAALITGLYATTIGAHQMRSLDGGYQPVPPPEVKTFTEYLRAAGYYTSSLTKLDYQFSGTVDGAPRTNWDDPAGDWRGREPGQPFFAHVTIFGTHESQLFGARPTETDPAAVSVPPYLPDTPVVRRDIARHYDNVARLDAHVGELLAMLEEDGVAESTVAVFFPDNGRGLPREKRWVYDGGIHLPLIVRWPGHLEPGEVNEELVSWIDLAPTVLALAGLPVPSHLQGRVFLGPDRAPEPEYVFATADRHDEARDRIRAVRDRRYAYVRNYHPETSYGQRRCRRSSACTTPARCCRRPTGTTSRRSRRRSCTTPSPIPSRSRTSPGVRSTRLASSACAPRTSAGWPKRATSARSPAGPIEVSLQSAVDGASIAYTFEEGESARWQLYARPIEVASSATLRAIAVRYGWAESVETVARFARGD